MALAARLRAVADRRSAIAGAPRPRRPPVRRPGLADAGDLLPAGAVARLGPPAGARLPPLRGVRPGGQDARHRRPDNNVRLWATTGRGPPARPADARRPGGPAIQAAAARSTSTRRSSSEPRSAAGPDGGGTFRRRPVAGRGRRSPSPASATPSRFLRGRDREGTQQDQQLPTGVGRCFSPDAKTLAGRGRRARPVGRHDGRRHQLSPAAAGEQLGRGGRPAGNDPPGMAFTPTARASSPRREFAEQNTTGRHGLTWPWARRCETKAVENAAGGVVAGGKVIAYTSADRSRPQGGLRRRPSRPVAEPVFGVMFAPDGKTRWPRHPSRHVLTPRTGELCARRPQRPSPHRRGRGGHRRAHRRRTGGATSPSLTASGLTAAGGTVRMWGAATGMNCRCPMATPAGHRGRARPDGKTVVSARPHDSPLEAPPRCHVFPVGSGDRRPLDGDRRGRVMT